MARSVVALAAASGLVIDDVHGEGAKADEEAWQRVARVELEQRVRAPRLVLLPLEADALVARHCQG